MPSIPAIIPEEVVEAVWLDVGALSDAAALREMNRVATDQPALLAFVVGDADGFSEDAAELGVYLLLVIMRVFEKHFGRRLKPIDVKTIERLRMEAEDSMDEVMEEDERWFERTDIVEGEKQPFVMRYVAECLFDTEDDETGLPDEDQDGLFLTMKVVVDALNASV